MCYSGTYWQGTYSSGSSTIQQQLRVAQAAGDEASRRRQTAEEGGSGGGIVKVCVCSPTSHPGSFRCRQHHGGYQWVSRVGSTTPA